jgi:hypothetical protein
MSVTQVMEQYQSILEEEIQDIAYVTGAVKRKGKIGVETLAQMMIFGFWQDPDVRLSGLAQIGGRREVYVTESAISQRFTPECASMFLKILQRLAEVRLEGCVAKKREKCEKLVLIVRIVRNYQHAGSNPFQMAPF